MFSHANAPATPVAAEPAAQTPQAEEPPKRARRTRAKAAPDQEAMIDAASQPVAQAPAPAAEAAADEAPARTPRRRRAAKVVEERTETSAEPAEDVKASVAELVQQERPRTRRRVKAETFGLSETTDAEKVLDSLAAAIGGRLDPVADPLDEDVEAEEDADLLAEDEDAEDEAADDAEGEGEGEDGTPRRRRRRRGGRRRRRGAGEAAAEGEEEEADGAEDDADAVAPAEAEAEAGEEPAGEGTSRRRRRRRRRGEDTGEAEDDSIDVVVRVREPRRRTGVSTNDEVTGIEGSTRMEAKKQRRREGRTAGRRRPPILSESEFLARREAVDRRMLIRQTDDYSQIAVLEDGILVEHYVDRASATSMIGNIYLGRIQNVLPSMEAAFVDIGRGRNAVLYAGEVDWESFGVSSADRKVERVFKSGQQVLVQVSKDPVGAKGARLTSHISIPGRYIVYSPGGHLSGISRKLPEGERRRLKGILDELIGPDASVIVRTAAEGASEEELIRDVNRLKAQWEVLEKKVKGGQAPAQLYAEPDLTVRIVRDLFTEDFGALIIDGNGQADDAYDTVDAYVTHVAPHLATRLEHWDRPGRGDMFSSFRVHEQVAKALERKVFLPSGGSLIIDRTEAMTVVDVNTGKFTGTSGNLEATVTSNNLEAAEEIVRQLRLRDIGGIIVIDFIDMVLPANRELLLRRLVECLGRDRTRHQVAEVTSLGLVQMTRKKIGTGLAEAFTVPCETCKGRGYHVHDVPVATQAPADGGDRDSGRRSPRMPASQPAGRRPGRARGTSGSSAPAAETVEATPVPAPAEPTPVPVPAEPSAVHAPAEAVVDSPVLETVAEAPREPVVAEAVFEEPALEAPIAEAAFEAPAVEAAAVEAPAEAPAEAAPANEDLVPSPSE
ncbi:Rne/Rng family ribonuclease [Propionicimonas sp.]|uniref:Rne/Rng family ribonuclease n=1 Tax=Propionicimonas sp. TaxID=1955623 RepID=UPI0039C9FB4E